MRTPSIHCGHQAQPAPSITITVTIGSLRPVHTPYGSVRYDKNVIYTCFEYFIIELKLNKIYLHQKEIYMVVVN